MTGQELGDGGHVRREALEARLAGYLAAAGTAATALACEADAAIVANPATQTFGINGVVSIDFNADGQTDFQVDHDRVNLTGVGDLDYLQIDKNDINGESNPLAFDPGPLMNFQATPFMDGTTDRNDANESAYVITGAQGSYPAALTQGTLIGPSSVFDFQEGGNFQGGGADIRANRLIDEDATQIDQVLGGQPPSGVHLPTDGPNFLGLGGQVHYLGLKMDLNNAASSPSGPFSYGWIGIRIDNEADATGAVVGYGYESTPDTGILAGDTGPFVANADFDDDGDVDGDDFLTWQRHAGTTVTAGTGANGDADGNGTVDGLDLALWRGDFASATAMAQVSTAAVPEPGSLLMTALGACSCCAGSPSHVADSRRFPFPRAVRQAWVGDLPAMSNDSPSSIENEASVRHLVDLGYEDPLVAAAQRRREVEVLEAALKQAQQILEAGELTDAIERLRRLAEQSPESPGPHRLLARAYYRAGELDAALSELRWLEAYGHEHAEFALLRAAIALGRRELHAALDQAEYARHLRDPLPAADVILGEAHFRRGDLPSAQSAYLRALDVENRNVAALAGLAAVKLRQGDFEASIDWALQALDQDMRLSAVHYCLGLALLRMDQRVEAAAALELAAKLNPQLAAPHRWLSRIYQDTDAPRAVEHRRLSHDILARRRSDRLRRHSGL